MYDIPINFRTKFTTELASAKKNGELLSDTVKKISECYTEDIGFGSRVLVTYGTGVTIEGRVWGFNSKGLVAVNRDGYKTTLNCERKDLQNLSVGSYGKLEQALWILNERMKELELLLKESEMPECFLNNEICIIKIVEVICQTSYPSSLLDTVSFINADNLKSYKFTLPTNYVKINEYYQVVITDNEIASVIKSDVIVFEAYKKK